MNRVLRSYGAIAVLLYGCARVLDLEDAEVDPTLGAKATAEGSLCETYCDTVLSSCTGEFAVYTGMDACLAICARLPAGTPGDLGVNSVECRLELAIEAASTPATSCAAAGPAGNGRCGENCEAFCALSDAICVGDDALEKAGAECAEACDGYPDLGTYTTDVRAGMSKGKHVQCRLYYLAQAALGDEELYCPYVDGQEPCE